MLKRAQEKAAEGKNLLKFNLMIIFYKTSIF